MGRPRKKTDEETPQAEDQATDELVSEQTPADAPAADVVEEAPAEPVADDVVTVAEKEGDETERVATVIDEGSTAEDAAAAEAAAAPEEPAAGAEPAAEPAEETAPEAPTAEAPVAEPKKKRKRLPRSERRQRPKAKREPAGERKPIIRLEKPESLRGQRKERRGVVVSSVMDKTIVVRVDTVKPHPVYKKVVRRSAKFHAHDERNVAKTGDLVRIVESRPYSKTKKWRLAEVLEEAK